MTDNNNSMLGRNKKAHRDPALDTGLVTTEKVEDSFIQYYVSQTYVNFTKANAIWKKKTQLRKCPLPD